MINYGQSGFRSPEFVWFTGVVDDRHDPLVLNRVKIRAFGYHTEDKAKLPTEALPWAAVLMPTTSSGTSGVGDGVHGLVEGSWVMGFFRDGPDAQDPVVIGTIMGNNDSGAEPTMGFNDPYGVFPREAGSDSGARALGTDDERKAAVGVYEPEDAYKPEYPYNKAKVTESGHILEFDDTPGAERISIQHRAGAFIEMRPDNKMRTRSQERYDAMTQWIVTVSGDCSLNVGGSLSATVQGNSRIGVGGSANLDVKGNSIQRINGSSVTYTTGNTQLQTTSDINVKSSGNLRIDSAGSITLRSDGDAFLIGKNVTISAEETLSLLGKEIFQSAIETQSIIAPNYAVNVEETISIQSTKLESIHSTVEFDADAQMDLTAPTLNIDSSSQFNARSATTNLSATSTMNIAGGTSNIGSSGTTNIKSSRLNLNPGGTMSTTSAASDVKSPDPLPPIETAKLPGIGFTEDEASPFEVFIEEADTDIQFPLPRYSVIKPDGTSSPSQQTYALATTGRYGRDNSQISGYTGTNLGLNETRGTGGQGAVPSTGKIILGGPGIAGPSVQYVNQYATRNKEVSSQMESILKSAAQSTGLDVQIFSGGMTSDRRTGSNRHLDGNAADVWLYKDGQRLFSTDSDFQAFARAAKNAGATAIGAGVGYMGGVGLHIDVAAGKSMPSDSATVWGSGGRRANAPSWLVQIMEG